MRSRLVKDWEKEVDAVKRAMAKESELARRGLKSEMPEPLYHDPNFSEAAIPG